MKVTIFYGFSHTTLLQKPFGKLSRNEQPDPIYILICVKISRILYGLIQDVNNLALSILIAMIYCRRKLRRLLQVFLAKLVVGFDNRHIMMCFRLYHYSGIFHYYFVIHKHCSNVSELKKHQVL